MSQKIPPLAPNAQPTQAPHLGAVTTTEGLVAAGLVVPEAAEALRRVEENFRIRLSATVRANPDPGVLDQFVPDPRELQILPEELADPIGDEAHHPQGPAGAVTGITHRYPDRVILHATQTCEVYCRFCFRREAVGENGQLAEDEFARVLDYLRATPAVREVIFTGGDPLVLSARRLGEMVRALSAIPSVEILRFHTRIPVVAPQKITDEMVAVLGADPAVWLVVHTNHPSEITPQAVAAFRRLSSAGIPLLSQSVLLKGINADPDTLEALFRALIRNRVKPYYLHHPDLAQGTGHFRLSLAEGRAIFGALRGRLSGIALPTYILDIPGGHGKVPIVPDYFEALGAGEWRVTDPKGQTHLYRDL